ncbi:endonuclease [Derxia lacustris]|uniref:endonuclease n=1 Tax=Derxia lacustris TaxID=764842 RepID=UPI000A16CF35|nr:endonuclease [Derxia lacustris]
MVTKSKPIGVYGKIIEMIFHRHYRDGLQSFEFDRSEFTSAAIELGYPPPANLGDVLYTFRFRRAFPKSILATATEGKEWIIELHGQSTYRFRLDKISRIVPQMGLVAIDIPDATPEIVLRYTQSDEQALLAKLRYNRLIDIFLSVATYSLQNHLRTTILADGGRAQIEIDELYVGVDTEGSHYVIPVQAKGGKDQIGVVQTMQDLVFCQQKFPDLKCRLISAQFLPKEVIALFELVVQEGELRIKSEKHYRLVACTSYEPGSGRLPAN